MKKTLFLGILMIIMITGLVSAITEPTLTSTNYDKSLCNKLLDVATVDKTMPKFIPFKNEVFDVYNLKNEAVGHVKIKDGIIVETQCKLSDEDKATYDVFIKSSETIDKIEEAESPSKAYQDAKKEGDIIIKGKSFSKGLKIGFINFFAKIASWF